MTLFSRPTLEADLERYRQNGDFAAQAETLMALAELAYEEQEYNITQGLYGQAWAAYVKVGDKRGIARSVHALGDILAVIFDEYGGFRPLEFERPDIRKLYASAIALYADLKDHRGQAEVYISVGNEGQQADDLEMAQVAYRQALSLYETLRDYLKQADTLSVLAKSYEKLSYAEHQRLFEQAIALYQQIDHKIGEAQSLLYLAGTALEYRRYTEARHYAEKAHILFALLDDKEKFEQAFRLMRIEIPSYQEPDVHNVSLLNTHQELDKYISNKT